MTDFFILDEANEIEPLPVSGPGYGRLYTAEMELELIREHVRRAMIGLVPLPIFVPRRPSLRSRLLASTMPYPSG